MITSLNKILKKKTNQVFFIAEIGKNYIQNKNSNSVKSAIENVKKLIIAAKNSGADAVKLQTHVVGDEIYNINFKSPHFNSLDRYNWVKLNEFLTPLNEFYIEINEYCKQNNIILFSTPMSKLAAKKISKLNPKLWKLGSGDIKDYLMLDYICKKNRPLIISTGMVGYKELDQVYKFIKSYNVNPIIFYCISKYPCPPKEFNLSSILRLKNIYPSSTIGFSDHSIIGHESVAAAVSFGAEIIEKHFSFSRSYWGSDHKSSITPKEFEKMVKFIKSKQYLDYDYAKYYGQYNLELEGMKNQFKPFFEKTLVANKKIQKGKKITINDLNAMRPKFALKGIPSDQLFSVIGKYARKDIFEKSIIKKDMIYD